MTPRGVFVRALVSVATLVVLTAGSAGAQVVDYPAQYFRGRAGAAEPIEGRLIVADTALFFTQKNGRPIFTFPYEFLDNAYGSQGLYGPSEDKTDSHYLVVVSGQLGRQETVVFRAAPFVPDTLAAAIASRLDARRQARYASPATQPQVQSDEESYEPAVARVPSSSVPPGPQNSRAPAKVSAKADEIGPGTLGYKDPSTATIFGLLITGAGHIYAGEGGTGAMLLVGSIAAVGIGAGLSKSECGFYSCNTDYTPLYVGVGAAGLFALISIFDAAPAAHRHNRRVAKSLGMNSVEPLWVTGPSGTRLGLRVPLGRAASVR
jgi:hypothetical protein